MRATWIGLFVTLLGTCIACGESGDERHAGPTGGSGGNGATAGVHPGGFGGVDSGSGGAAPEPAPIDPTRVHSYDGVGTRTSFGPTHALEPIAGQAFSVSVWVRPTVIDGYDTILGRPSPCGTSGNYIVDFIGQQPRFCYRDPAQAADHCAMIGDTDVPLGDWTHVAMTYTFGDGPSFHGYVNGKLVNTGTWYTGDGNAAPWNDPTAKTEAGHFAGCASGKEYFYQGDLYELAAYERILSLDEIEQHYLRTVALPCSEKNDRKDAVTLTLIDGDATGYATFQSHNQKVLANQHGIFVSYIRTRNEPYTAQEWRLLRSMDGGASFQIVFDETTGTNPPALETDPHGNIYAMKQKYDAPPDSTLMIFRPENDFASPDSHTIPNGNSGKFAMLYDWRQSQLYYFSHEGRFYRIALDGTVTFNQPLIVSGPNADPQYPLLSMDEDGVVYAAWTTVKHGEYLYWNIGSARSHDSGTTWERFDGTPLPTPIICDDTGPANAVQLSDELTSHTWLWNVLAKNNKVHFAYLAQTTPSRQNYVRFDAVTGAEDLRIAPVFGGGTTSLLSLDGFAGNDPGMPNRLFWTAPSASGSPRIAVLQSTENGASWLDFAQGGDATLQPYALGGARFLAENGDLLGTFTDVSDSAHAKVYFLRASTRTTSDPAGCL